MKNTALCLSYLRLLLRSVPLILILVTPGFAYDNSHFPVHTINKGCLQVTTDNCPDKTVQVDLRVCAGDCGFDYCFGDFFEKKNRWERVCATNAVLSIRFTNQSGGWAKCSVTGDMRAGASRTMKFLVKIDYPVKNKMFYLKDDASDKNDRFLRPFDGVDIYCESRPGVSEKFPIGQVIDKAMLSPTHSISFVIEKTGIRLIDGIK